MKITSLQLLLLNQSEPIKAVRQALGVERTVIWQWKRGVSFPNRLNAEKLIDFYGPARLDYNGCFIASVEITDEQARLYRLLTEVVG